MNPIRILVVEDESVIAFDLELQLTNLGYQVVGVVSSGEAVLARVSQSCPDIVLIDIHLEGGMDGIDAAWQVRELYRIPVVFLTAYAEDHTLQRAMESQPYGYLVKPCEGRELHATLQMALVRHAADTAIEASEQRLRLAMDAAGLGIWEWDQDNGQATTGGLFHAILDGPAETGGEGLESLLSRVHPEDRPEMETALRRLQERPAKIARTFRHLRRDGRLAWVEVHTQSYVGRKAGIIGVIRDITQQRETQERPQTSATVLDNATEGMYSLPTAHTESSP